MGKVFEYLNRKEIKKNVLNFNEKDYVIKTNFNLLYFILERQNEISIKEEKEEERKKKFLKNKKNKESDYKPGYNSGFDNMKLMMDFLKIAVGEDFVEEVKNQPFETEEIAFLFNVVVNMVNGMSEDEAFEEATNGESKKN
jgi:hypothetical protein